MSQTTMIRGADGRLYAISSNGVSTIAETSAPLSNALRAGDIAAFDTADHEASRTWISPGA